MKLIFWDKKANTYHRETNVEQCTATQTVVNGHNRNCYVLYLKGKLVDKVLYRSRFELERIELETMEG